MSEEERISYWYEGLKAEWVKRKNDHSKDCLSKDSKSETLRPSAGTCGRHIFPGEEVGAFVSPLRHMLEYQEYKDGDHAAVFVRCKDCAPTYRANRRSYSGRTTRLNPEMPTAR